MKKLHEGLRIGDLTDMVLPLISVDEYESKIDDKKAIVIGFYVQDEDAAKDLNKFLQKCYVSLLDSDISPAPDQRGFYLVFVELLKDETLVKNLTAILKDVTPLTGIKDWQMRIRKIKDVIDFTPEKFAKVMVHLKKLDERREIISFVQESGFSEVGFKDKLLVMATPSGQQFFDILGFGETETILEKLSFGKVATNISINEAVRANKLQSLLGENWYVWNAKDVFVLHKNDDAKCLVLKSMI